jgi:VWFA-related protein
MTRSFYMMAVLQAAAALLPPLSAQPAASDEVRVSSQPYAPQASYTFRAETRLVDVGAAVRDGHGRAVPGLTRDNFRIYDDGKLRNIATFSEYRPGSDAVAAKASGAAPENTAAGETAPAMPPVTAGRKRYLAVFFDDLNEAYGEEAGDVQRTQDAASKYVISSLKPGVEIGVFTASGTPAVDFTGDSEKLLAAIAEVKAHPQYLEKVCSGMNPYQAYRIAKLNDRETIRLVMIAGAKHQCPSSPNAIMVRATEVWDKVKATSTQTLVSVARVVNYLGAKRGERVLLLASTGFVGQTMEPEQDRIIDQAVHYGVVINSLVTKGLYNELMAGERWDDPAPMPKRAMAVANARNQAWAKAENAEVEERPMVMDDAMGNLARGTGGVLFHNNNDLNAGFRETSVPPEVTYRMSFNPEGVISDGAYHKIRVELVDAKSYSVEARPGYFAQEDTAEKLRTNLDTAVMGADTMADVAAGVALEIGKGTGAERSVRVVTHLDISKLPFGKENDRQSQRITIVAAFFDSQGKIVAAKEGRMELALKPETYGRMSGTGVNADLTFQMPPGIYKLRAVVEEAVKGGIASSTYPIDVR